IEEEISHDMMAIVKAVSEVCGDSGRWVHYGATSNDILDTATGLQLTQAMDLIDAKLKNLLRVLIGGRRRRSRLLRWAGRTGSRVSRPRTASGLPSGQAKWAGILNASNSSVPGWQSGR